MSGQKQTSNGPDQTSSYEVRQAGNILPNLISSVSVEIGGNVIQRWDSTELVMMWTKFDCRHPYTDAEIRQIEADIKHNAEKKHIE